MINTNLSGRHLHHPTVFPFFFDAEKMLFTAMMTQPEISPFEDIITVRYDTLSAVRRLFAVAIKYSPVTPTHLSHISSFNRLSINIGLGTNRNNEHLQLKKTCTAKSCQRAHFPSRKGANLPWSRLSRLRRAQSPEPRSPGGFSEALVNVTSLTSHQAEPMPPQFQGCARLPTWWLNLLCRHLVIKVTQ